MQSTTPHPVIVRTPEEVAPRLLTTERTLERWRSNGSGPAFVKIGRRVGYRDEDIDAFVASQVRQHTGQSLEKRSAPTRANGQGR